MSAPLSPQQIERALELQALGRTQSQIAAELGCDRRTVGRRLRRYNASLWARLITQGEMEKARQVQILQRMVSEALQAWEQSRKPAVTVKTTSSEDGERTEKQVKDQCGSAPILAEARLALAEIRKVLNLDDASSAEATASTLASVGQVLELALAALPEDLRGPTRERMATALLEARANGRPDA